MKKKVFEPENPEEAEVTVSMPNSPSSADSVQKFSSVAATRVFTGRFPGAGVKLCQAVKRFALTTRTARTLLVDD